MAKDDGKKSGKHEDAAARKALKRALKDSPVLRAALIAAIEAGAAAALDVVRKASDAELVKLAGEKPSKKAKQGKTDVAAAKTALPAG